MCQFQTLYYNNLVGYVVKCSHCNSFQMGYGNIIINCGVEDFTCFYRKVKSFVADLLNQSELSGIKSVVIATPCEGIHLYLSEREMVELYKMLDESDSEWKFQHLTTLVSKN